MTKSNIKLMLTFVTESKVHVLLSLFGVSYTVSIRQKKMYYMVFITKFGTLSRRKNSQLGHFHDSKIPNWIGTGVIPNWVKKKRCQWLLTPIDYMLRHSLYANGVLTVTQNAFVLELIGITGI